MIYTTYILPIDTLINFPITFTQTNLKYKIIPSLINKGLVKRINVGYNRKYGENDIQKGKALYDCLKLTNSGIKHIQELGTTQELEATREYYKSQCSHTSIQVEERIKRTVLTDLMFNPEFILQKIPYPLFIKRISHDQLFNELSENNFKYIPSIICKRTNMDLTEAKMYLTNLRNNEQWGDGKAIKSSKFYGIVMGDFGNLPIYNAGYHNVGISEQNEDTLINKLFSATGTPCNECIYVYQSPQRIKRIIDQKYTDSIWQQTQLITSVNQYRYIYLVPNGRENTEFSQINLRSKTTNLRDYYKTHKCFRYYDYVMAAPYIADALNSTGGIFDSQTDEHNYLIGYLPELRRIISIIRYYNNSFATKPLCVVCSKSQQSFYEVIFEEIKQNGKLNFLTEDFIYERGGVV